MVRNSSHALNVSGNLRETGSHLYLIQEDKYLPNLAGLFMFPELP